MKDIANNIALSIDGIAECVDYTTNHFLTNRDAGNASCALHYISFLDVVGRAEKHSTDIVFFEVHDDGFHSVVELQEFSCLGITQSVGTHHAITHGEYGADFRFIAETFGIVFYVSELLSQHSSDFAYFYLVRHYYT